MYVTSVMSVSPPAEMIDSYDEEQTPSPRGMQRAEMLRLLEEEVLTEREVMEGRSSALLYSFISSLEDREWRSVQDRMVEPVSQTHLAQVSTSIIRVVSQLLLQLQPKHQSRECEEPQRCSTLVGDHLHKYFEISEETLAQSLGSSASQLSVRSMLGDAVKQLNQGLRVLAAQSLDSTETTGSDVTSVAMKLLALAGEALADVTDDAAAQDIDAFLETATKEVMLTIAASVSSCQERDRKSSRILRDLTAKMTQGCSHVMVDLTEVELFSLKYDSIDQPSARPHVKTYPLLVSSEKVSGDLSESRGTCRQVLKGLLAKFLALFSPRSFSLMMGPHKSSLPTLESVSAEVLDIVVDAVKELCQKKTSKFPLRQHKKTKVSEERVDSSATEMKVALQEKLREFLTCHRGAVEEVKRDEMKEVKRTVSTLLSKLRDKTAECEETRQEQRPRVQTVRTLLDQIWRDKGLIRLENLTCEDKLSQSSPSEQVHCITEAAVKHLLMLLVLPPPSWGMGQVIRVQSSPSSAARFAETIQLYDDIISLYTQVTCEQVMSSLRRSSATSRLQLEVESLLEQMQGDDSAPKKKKNIAHFFQKLPKKIGNKWRKVTNRSNVYFSPCEDSEDEEAGVDASKLRRRRVVQFFQTLPDKIVTAFWGHSPTYWNAVVTFPM